MGYEVSVGGDPVNPNPFTYSQISITGNIVLVWPSNTQDATYTATDWIDITSSAAYSVAMPPATEAPEGEEVVFYNYGSFTITVNDSTGSGITTIASGETKRIWITDNSTEAGSWRIANIGSGTTSADASMLAGYGLIAQGGQLSQSMPPTEYGTDAVLTAGVRAHLVKWTSGMGTFVLDSPATLGSNWFTNISNSGSGLLTIDGNGANIDGSATIDVSPGQGFTIATDGIDFTTVGRVVPESSNFTLLTKSVAGSTDVTLTSSEAAYSIIYFTGVLTGNINVIVPATVNQWVMFNNTTGAFTLTVKTASGTGVAIVQGARRILNSDGTNVNFSDSVGSGTVTSIGTGTGLTGGPITTSGTISIANTAVVAGTYGGPLSVAGFTSNPQGQLTNAVDIPLDADLVAIASLAGTSGLLAKTAADTWALRNLASGAGISVSNPAGVAGNPTVSLSMEPITNSIVSDIPLNNTSNYFDGPSVAQGSSGTWFASGTITVSDSVGPAQIDAKLWDGTTVIASGVGRIFTTAAYTTISLSGYINNPTGNLRISAKDPSSTAGVIIADQTGLGKDSTITAFRIG